MKFANKYELFEAVTSGPVETFFAKDLSTGERVLLHIFEAPEKKPDQATVQWVLEAFRKAAPNPPGLVVETGQYTGTTYAYLVTKLPDSAALQQWAQSYESHVKETQEIAIPAETSPATTAISNAPAALPGNRPAKESTPPPGAISPGDFTAAFLRPPSPVSPRPDINSSKQADWDEINSQPEPTAPQKGPGEFTRQFFSESHEKPQRLDAQAPAKLPETNAPPNRGLSRTGAETRAAAKPEATEPPKQEPSAGGPSAGSGSSAAAGGFTALFRSDFKAESKTSSENVGVPSNDDDAKAGDFTDFFRGPFGGEKPAETFNTLPKAMDTPQPSAPGEFTRVFGSGRGSDFGAPPPLEGEVRDVRKEATAGPFTRLFPDANQSVAAPPANAERQAWEPAPPKSEVLPPPIEPSRIQPPPLTATPPAPPSIEPITSKPAVSNTARETGPALPRGATHVFSAVGGRLPISPPLSSGPSEYTRIISGGLKNAPEGAGIGSGSQNPASPPPKIVAPPPPKFSPPPAPKAPQLESKLPKPKASYLPLIIILNVLLCFAILLIVYFAMKR